MWNQEGHFKINTRVSCENQAEYVMIITIVSWNQAEHFKINADMLCGIKQSCLSYDKC